jgi:glucose-6-phosphate dehydrogenase assembly protein OpcA
MTDAERAIAGEDVRVDAASIEKSLAELWRGEKTGENDAITRAALWNVVAHTATSGHQASATVTLAKASAAVPQRTIIVRSNPSEEPSLNAWISANCHLLGGNKQVCTEEIAIVAGGERIHRVPPLVNSLLIPDMPVAIWWIGDLPGENEGYVEALLEPADRLIVDSVCFDSPGDLALISGIAERTATAPGDLNWVRLEEWRVAAASIFDPPSVRNRLSSIRRVRIVAGTSDSEFFGESIESLFFASWLSAQIGHHIDREGRVEGPAGTVDYRFERRMQSVDVGGVTFVEIQFDDGSCASIARDRDRGVLKANVDGIESTMESVTRSLSCDSSDLIVRQLKKPEGDRVFLRVLPLATRLARRIAR